MTSKAENLSVRLPGEVRKQVDELARMTRRSRSFIINEAVASYVQSQTRYAQEIAEAVQSVRSGTGHSSEQVFVWMESWANGTKLPVPAPDILPGK